LLLPENLVEGEQYPLVLFLHGAGERGRDNELQLRHFPERMVTDEYRKRYNCFVLAPQCPKDEYWVYVDWSDERSTPFAATPTSSMLGAIAALEKVVSDHPVDLDRIYLTGLSMGGYGTWDLATRHPGWFSAAAPICGGGDERMVAKLAGLPFSVWHGAADRVVPAGRSRTMVEALRELDAITNVEYHELEGVGHNSWTQAYGENGCLDWLFEQRRDPQAQFDAAANLTAEAIRPDERIAFLGDSITQSGNRRGGYVDLLRTAISEKRPDARVIPARISGHRVPNLLKRFHRDVIDKKATLVFVYIGINDVWHSQSGRGTPADEYEAGLRTIVRELRASGADVVLATPSVIGERPVVGDNELDEMLEQYAAMSRKVAEEEGATLCDLRRAFQNHLKIFNAANGVDRGVLTTDGVHLNAAGNLFVATHAARALREAALARQ
jgi:lysophospholipase L1-like esterase/predicted esterase